MLFRAQETKPVVPDEIGWCAGYPDIRVIAVTGDHTTMLESPHLETLCERFTEVVRRTFPAGA